MNFNTGKIIIMIFLIALLLQPLIFGIINMFSRSEYETTVIISAKQNPFNYCQIFVNLERRNMTNVGIRIPCSAMSPAFVGEEVKVCYHHFGHPDPRLEDGFFERNDECSQLSFSTSWQLIACWVLFTWLLLIPVTHLF